MSDQSLRERLMRNRQRQQGVLVDGFLRDLMEWLSANGLAIVPVEATRDMHAQWVLQSSWPNSWRALLKAAPPAAVLLKGTQDE